MTAESQNKLLARRFLEEVVNTGAVDRLSDFLPPEYVAPILGIAGKAREHLLTFRQCYPDMVVPVEGQVAEGDIVATWYVMRGTHLGAFGGVPATGKKITLRAVNVQKIRGGRIDWRPVWDQCAHVIFLKPEPMPPLARFLTAEKRSDHWTDLFAGLHNIQLELVNKGGSVRARDEFRAMLSCSRLCWQRVLAEKDNDKEWLPSPRQTGLRGLKVTQAQVDVWMRVLDELEAVANGQKLLAHWGRFRHQRRQAHRFASPS